MSEEIATEPEYEEIDPETLEELKPGDELALNDPIESEESGA